jgi:hypothetical protein
MRKHTRRKVWALMTPFHAIEGAAITPEPLLDKLRLIELASMDSIRRGAGSAQDRAHIESMCRISIVMGERKIGAEVLEAANLLAAELTKAKDMVTERGRFALTGPGLCAMRDVWEYHDLQRQSIPRATYEQCIQQEVNNQKSGKYAQSH